MERTNRAWVSRRRDVAAVVVSIAALSCGGPQTAPTIVTNNTPTSGTDVLALDVSCPASLLIGQRAPCLAVARLRSGQTPVVSFDATWSSTRADVVAVDAMGLLTGRSDGQATISASYQGREGTAAIVVTAKDGLHIASAQAHQGDFTPGSSVTMWLQGYYSVASAETGRLSLKITDQTRTVATTAPTTVVKGGDFFLMSSTFIVPQDSVEVCRTAVLEVGAVTVAEPTSNANGLWCISIRR